MRLNATRRRSLVSAYATVRHLLRQMEEAAGSGRSPSGVGSPLTPLPPDLSEAVIVPLRQLESRLHEAAQRLAPAELAAFEQPQGTGSTLVWVSNLLERIRYVVDDLHPSRQQRYGSVEDDEGQTLGVLHEELASLISASREVLNALGIPSKHDQQAGAGHESPP